MPRVEKLFFVWSLTRFKQLKLYHDGHCTHARIPGLCRIDTDKTFRPNYLLLFSQTSEMNGEKASERKIAEAYLNNITFNNRATCHVR